MPDQRLHLATRQLHLVAIPGSLAATRELGIFFEMETLRADGTGTRTGGGAPLMKRGDSEPGGRTEFRFVLIHSRQLVQIVTGEKSKKKLPNALHHF